MGNSNLQGFTPTISESLPGPEWLNEIRNDAYTQLNEVEAPDTEEEVWRYSRVNELNLSELTPKSERPENLASIPLDRFSSPSAIIVLQDGWITNITIGEEAEEAAELDSLDRLLLSPSCRSATILGLPEEPRDVLAEECALGLLVLLLAARLVH